MFGTNDALDAISDRSRSVAQIGEDLVYEHAQAYFAAQNELVQMIAPEWIEETTDYLRRTGGPSSHMKMQKLGEFGTTDVQKVSLATENLGFPIYRFGEAVQWTRDYFRRVSGEQFANLLREIALADTANVLYEIKNALFDPTNFTFVNEASPLTDGVDVDIPVKRLANGVSAIYPPKPHGVAVPSDHNHYLGSATLTNSAVKGLVDTVTEHADSGDVRLYISKADEATVSGLTDFKPYTDPRIILPITQEQLRNGNTLDIRNTYNRRIGIFREAEVWVKPWVPQNYLVCFISGGNQRKVLAWRKPTYVSNGLELVADNEQYPLRAREYVREFGIGVQNRVGAAILYIGGSSYVKPTL